MKKFWLLTYGGGALIYVCYAFLFDRLFLVTGIEAPFVVATAIPAVLSYIFVMWRQRMTAECLVPAPDPQAFLQGFSMFVQRTLRLRQSPDAPSTPAAALGTATASLPSRLEFVPATWRSRLQLGIAVTLPHAGQAVVTGQVCQLKLIKKRFSGATISRLVDTKLPGEELAFISRKTFGWCALVVHLILFVQLLALLGIEGTRPEGAADVSKRADAPTAVAGGDFTDTLTLSRDQAQAGTVVNLAIPGRERLVKVRVPAGVRNGQRFVYRGAGRPGLNGGAPGDLHVAVSIQ